MQGSIDFVNHILRGRLRQWAIRDLLDASAPLDRGSLLDQISGILEKFVAMLSIADQLDRELSLDTVLERIIAASIEVTGSERGSVFLHDPETDELFSRAFAGGSVVQEIRFPGNRGIAGSVFGTGEWCIVADAYSDSRFNPEVDRSTGVRTRNILCVPIRTSTSEIIGVVQVLNRCLGDYSQDDAAVLEITAAQASAALTRSQLYDRIEQAHKEENRMQGLLTALSRQLELRPLVGDIVAAVTELLGADRSTVFLHDPRRNELFSFLAERLEESEIRIPSSAGLAGWCFTNGQTLNIPDAYADSRFNQAVDHKTGYRTRNVLCMPILNRENRCLGVIQVINKQRGSFTGFDERRLGTFAAQVSIAIENATHFEEIRNMRNYSEGMLESLSSGVLTLDADHTIQKCNHAFVSLFQTTHESVVSHSAASFFTGRNAWVLDKVRLVSPDHSSDVTVDAEIDLEQGARRLSVNLTVVPLRGTKGESLGTMLIFEDITTEKRLKTTMARYMAKEVAEKLLSYGEDVLGGMVQNATVLFSDVRQFTSLTESLGAQATVKLLNEYFSIMVDCVLSEEGILDKFIGDALMAVFGVPFARIDDADRAVRAALRMFQELRKFNVKRIGDGNPPIRMGVGINTGELVSGNIGSLKRMDYTVIGDHVNLAARLETLSKHYGVPLLISEFTATALQNRYLMREVDRVIVMGKNQPVTVYQVLEESDDPENALDSEMLGVFAEGMAYYHQRDWSSARNCFAAALAAKPIDKLSDVYIRRCDQFLAQPPPPQWDGVWVMTSK